MTPLNISFTAIVVCSTLSRVVIPLNDKDRKLAICDPNPLDILTFSLDSHMDL